jgi:hypothetical protein
LRFIRYNAISIRFVLVKADMEMVEKIIKTTWRKAYEIYEKPIDKKVHAITSH